MMVEVKNIFQRSVLIKVKKTDFVYFRSLRNIARVFVKFEERKTNKYIEVNVTNDFVTAKKCMEEINKFKTIGPSRK